MALLMVYAYSHITTLLSKSIIFGTNEYSKATGTGCLESEALLSSNVKNTFNLKELHRQIIIIRAQRCMVLIYLMTFSQSHEPITVAARSKIRNVFVRSNFLIVDSHPTQGMDACVFV
jgi:hypothetical protein